MSYVNIPDWSMSLPESPAVFVLGKRRSGKSFVTRYILKKLIEADAADVIIVFCDDDDEEGAYREILRPQDKVLRGYSEETVKAIYDRNEQLRAKITLVFDDCIATAPRHGIMDKIFSNGRHRNISCFAQSQYHAMITPLMRSNADIWLILKQGPDVREFILSEVLKGVKNNQQLMNHTASQGDVLVLDFWTDVPKDNVDEKGIINCFLPFRFRAPRSS